jgi:hypothetical protein
MLPSLLRGGAALVAFVALGFFPGATSAQQVTDPLRVFFDCEGPSCEQEFYRTEIDWVDWVRQREDSDVHVIVASQSNASGGRAYEIRFIGQGDLEGVDDDLRFSSLGTDVEQERLDGIATVLSIGFARYATLMGIRDVVTIEGTRSVGVDPNERVVGADEVDDPWNLWSFRIGGNINLDGEDTRNSRDVNGSFSADRVSLGWILGLDFSYGNNRREIERSDGSIFENTQEDWNASTEVVHSIADHWSVGFVTSSGKQPRFNQKFRFELQPGLEYSYFPYEQATRRALTGYYGVGPAYREYEEETVFGETEETRWQHLLRIEFSQRQPWGDASVNVQGEQYLHDTELYSVSFNGNLEFRLFRGLSLDVRGSYSFGDDQIYLAAGGLSDEEILLRLAQRQSNERYNLRVGFNYRFGSIYNNIVNNRFDGRTGGFGGGGMGFF